jgi:hypothetical protein
VSKQDGNRYCLAVAEEELRKAILAERAEIKGATMRRQRAEIEVEKWRRRCLVADATVARHFGPEGQP